jgi:glycosyltransferase involved in cell wall biosynthesis
MRPVRLLMDFIRGYSSYIEIARTIKADAIISNTSPTPLGGIVARVLNIPHFCHLRESYANFGWVWRLYMPFLLHYSKKILCVSQAMADQFPVRWHQSKVVVLHDGFPFDEFKPVEQLRIEAFVRDYNLENRILVGLIGRIILQRKGQDIFVRAISLLKEDFPDARFLMVGSCYPGNEFHLDHLNALIGELGVRENIVLTGEAKDVKAVYSALDVSVMASAHPEPFGGVTLESMAFGKPVVGTNIGGTPEQIIDGETGILIAPNEPQEMAEAIRLLLEDADLRKRMGAAGKTRFFKEFGFEPYYERLMGFYGDAGVGF